MAAFQGPIFGFQADIEDTITPQDWQRAAMCRAADSTNYYVCVAECRYSDENDVFDDGYAVDVYDGTTASDELSRKFCCFDDAIKYANNGICVASE